MACELLDSLGISDKNSANFRRRQITELNRVNWSFYDYIVEPKPCLERIGRGVLGFRESAGEGGVEVLDDPDFPIRVSGRDPEDLGRALVLVADTEGALLVRIRVGRGFGLEVGGSFGSGG